MGQREIALRTDDRATVHTASPNLYEPKGSRVAFEEPMQWLGPDDPPTYRGGLCTTLRVAQSAA